TPASPGGDKPAAAAKTAPAPEVAEPAAAPAFGSSAPPAEEVPLNPFADSIVADSGYEAMEEVSLEQLLEGRERPATMSGALPVPMEAIEESMHESLHDSMHESMDEVEELGAEEVVDEPAVAVAFADEPSPMVHASGS